MVTISKGLAWIKDIKMKSILEDFTSDLVILDMTKNFNSRSLLTLSIGLKWNFFLVKNWISKFAISLKKTLYVKTYGPDKDIWKVLYDLDLWPRNFVQGHCTPFDQKNSLSEIWARLITLTLNLEKRKYSPYHKSSLEGRHDFVKDFTHNFTMTLTLYLEKRKYSPDHKSWLEGRHDFVKDNFFRIIGL